MRFGRALLVVALATTLPLTGCSLLFVQPPHEEYGYRGVAGCTTTRAAPVIDTIFTMTNFVSALYVASEDNVTNKGTAVGAGLAVGALWLSSAIYGYYNTNRCAELQADNYDDRPYRRPVYNAPPSWRVAPRPAPAPAPPPPPPAAAPVDGAPDAPPVGAAPPQVAPPAGTPVVPQQSDDDDPRRRRDNVGQPSGPRAYPE